MKKLFLAQSLIALGFIGACSAGGAGGGGSGLRGLVEETGGGGSGPGGGTGGRLAGSGGVNAVITGGRPNLGTGGTGGKTGGTVFGAGGTASSGGTTSKLTGGTTGAGGSVGSGGASGTGGAQGSTGGGSALGGTGGTSAAGGTASASGGATSGTGGKGATGGTGGAGTGGAGTGGAGTGGAGTGGAGTGGAGTGGSSNGLIGHWPFDEASGTMAADTSGHGHNLTLSGCATLGTSGKLGKRLTLGTGTPRLNDCSGAATNSSVDFGNLTKVTVSLWFQNESGADAYAYQAGLFDLDSAMSLSWDFDNLGWFAGSAETLGQSPTGNAWHHLAGTKNSSTGEVHIFLDGSELNVGTGAAADSGAHLLSIGKSNIPDTYGFSGGIDDVRVYNRVLTAQEITNCAGVAGCPAN